MKKKYHGVEEVKSPMGSRVRGQRVAHQFSSLSRVSRYPIFSLETLMDKA